jgi:RNA polymerase sigma factor (sigma-70 family)
LGGEQVLATDGAIGQLLEALQSDEAEAAWSAFLTSYSELMFAVVRTFAKDDDHSSDCFLFVCEKLADKKYRRLSAFRLNGKAQFSTWLRAVVRNLCLDWYRSRFGRRGIFRSIAVREAVDQEIFIAAFQHGASTYEIWLELSRQGHGLSYRDVELRIEQLRGLLSARQLWLLSTTRESIEVISVDREQATFDIPDHRPSPETIAILRETEAMVRKALAQIDAGDRILLRLRFQEGLALLEVAKLVGLKDAQTADRRIREAIERLRGILGQPAILYGKRRSASV